MGFGFGLGLAMDSGFTFSFFFFFFLLDIDVIRVGEVVVHCLELVCLLELDVGLLSGAWTPIITKSISTGPIFVQREKE
jgi:hypothetical protein